VRGLVLRTLLSVHYNFFSPTSKSGKYNHESGMANIKKPSLNGVCKVNFDLWGGFFFLFYTSTAAACWTGKDRSLLFTVKKGKND
jgi:hypothetical protein